MWFCLSSLLAWSAPQLELSIPVGEDASLRVLPRVNPSLIEVMIYSSDEDLSWLKAKSTPQIRYMMPRGVGSGQWLLRLAPLEPSDGFTIEVVEGQLEIRVHPLSDPEPAVPVDPPTLDDLLGDTEIVYPQPPPDPGLVLFTGDAIPYKIDPQDFPVSFANFTNEGTWHAVDEARADLIPVLECLGVECEQKRSLANFELAKNYFEMGLVRQARYYLERLGQEPGSVPIAEIALARAKADLSVGRWDSAYERLLEAKEYGAPDSAILEGLALVSLATGHPQRAPTGRLLAQEAQTPEVMLLAAELLQMERFYQESVGLLLPLPEQLTGEWQQRAALRLGDGLLFSGEPDLARKAWQFVPRDLLQLRNIYAKMISNVHDWVKVMPHLGQLSRGRTEASAEALYLMSQVDVVFGPQDDAIYDLHELVEMDPQRSLDSDVLDRLWVLLSKRIRMLTEEERWYAVASQYESSWHNLLLKKVDDPTPLILVAQAYENLGLVDEALEVLRLGLSSQVIQGQDSPDDLFYLASLYLKVGDSAAGFETVQYMEDIGLPPELRGSVNLLMADLHLSNDDNDAARRYLRLASQDPRVRAVASVREAILDAHDGRCIQAVDGFQRYLTEEMVEPEAYLMYSRCLAIIGRETQATEVAALASEQAPMIDNARYSRYLADLEADDSSSDIWNALMLERDAQQEFAEELSVWRASKNP